MCGIAGVLTNRGYPESELRGIAQGMARVLVHRGPDDEGAWVDPEAGIGLGFRRLAILDLSENGRQPMRSASGRWTVIFNGEIYNCAVLRDELRHFGAQFRGHSDTEVILAAFERWGIRSALPRFIGMFALAVWDAGDRRLTLVRDRLGKKPLYLYHEPGLLLFGSELKAIFTVPGVDKDIDRRSLTAYLRYLYVPSPGTVLSRVRKLPPGHLVEIVNPACRLPPMESYWDAVDIAQRGALVSAPPSESDAVDRLDQLLSDAVRLRMYADVPVGALLSGGIDSSLVTAMMAGISHQPVRTFTVSFGEERYDEARHAARVAAYLGTHHSEQRLAGEDALDLVPRIPDLFDEPLADPSQLPTVLVCQMARREVTVALSGDGGDEIFAGYNRYITGRKIIPRLARLPLPVRRSVAAFAGLLSTSSLGRLVPHFGSGQRAGERFDKLRSLARANTVPEMYRSLVSAVQDPAELVRGGVDDPGLMMDCLGREIPDDLLGRFMLGDQLTYLPDDQLARVDRASMAVSLEVRSPLLDHRVVEFGWSVPASLRIRKGSGKWLLRQVLYRRIPRDLVDRPKMGFSVPLHTWLAGPLRPWAEDLLADGKWQSDGPLDPVAVRGVWRRFLAGKRILAHAVWAILVFRAWEERWCR